MVENSPNNSPADGQPPVPTSHGVPWDFEQPIGQPAQYPYGSAPTGSFPPGPTPEQPPADSQRNLLPFSRLNVSAAMASATTSLLNTPWLWLLVAVIWCLQYLAERIVEVIVTSASIGGVISTVVGTAIHLLPISAVIVVLYRVAYARVAGEPMTWRQWFTWNQFGVAVILAAVMRLIEPVMLWIAIYGYSVWENFQPDDYRTVFYLPLSMYFEMPRFLSVFLVSFVAMLLFPAFEGNNFSESFRAGLRIGLKYYVVIFIVVFALWVITMITGLFVLDLTRQPSMRPDFIVPLLLMPWCAVFYAHIYRQATHKYVAKPATKRSGTD